MDENSFVQRSWISKNDMRIGLLLKRDIRQKDKIQIGFQTEGGSTAMNKSKPSIDPLFKMLKIKIEQINNTEELPDKLPQE